MIVKSLVYILLNAAFDFGLYSWEIVGVSLT